VIKSIAEKVIAPQAKKDPKTVNILGAVPSHDVFYEGNLDEIKRLLGLLGIKANTFFGLGEDVSRIRQYGGAGHSIVLSRRAGVQAALAFEETHGIPWSHLELPIGPAGTEHFLREAGRILNVGKSVVEQAIADEKRYYWHYLERIVENYGDIDFQNYLVTIADSYYAHAITKFLVNDFGWVPHFVAVHDLESELEQQSYRALFDDLAAETKPTILFEQNNIELEKALRNSWPQFRNEKYYNKLDHVYIVGSSLERGLANEFGAGFLPAVFPVANRLVLNRGYAGYRGALTLVEDIISSLLSGR
jgi:nitrogenase molybdenum-iron protein beta chain